MIAPTGEVTSSVLYSVLGPALKERHKDAGVYPKKGDKDGEKS